jgi:hypothetical protein
MRIEYRAVRFKTLRINADQYIASLPIKERTIYIEQDPSEDLWLPNILVDRVVLKYCLNYASGLEALRKVRDSALAMIKPGGEVVSISRACENGEELARRIDASGADPAMSNLSNREIIGLTPQAGVFLAGTTTFIPTDVDDAARFKDFATQVLLPRKALDLRFVPTNRFTTRVVDVGLTWQKPSLR